MDQNVSTDTNQSRKREVVAQVLYWVGLPLMICWQIVSIVFAILFAWVAKSDAIAPFWFNSLDRALAIVGSILSQTQQYETKLFDTAAIAVSAIAMGVFLRRWSKPAGTFEILVVIILLVLGMGQLVILFVLPTPEQAFLDIPNGKRMVENLSLLLSRNSNVALAICGAALGISLPKKD